MRGSRVRSWKAAALVAFAMLNLVIFFLLFTQAGGRPPWHDAYKVTAVLPEPLNTVDNSDVRLAGVKVGRVVEIESRGELALVTFEIEDDYVPMYENGTVTPRTKTLVGETYLAIDPGDPSSGEIPDGGEMKLKQTEEIVPLERLLSTLNAKTRQHVRRNLRSFGGGLDGHGDDLNRLFAAARPMVADGGALMQILRGQRDDLAGAIDNTASVMQAFADRTEQVRTLAVQAKATAEIAASRDASMRQIFRELPSTLSQARSSLEQLGDFSTGATPVVRDLRFAVDELGPTLRDLEPAAADGRELFRELPEFIDQANPLLSALPPLSDELRPAAGSLEGLLREANPALLYLSQYENEVGSFFGNVGSINDVYDSTGALARVHAVAGPTSFDGVLTSSDSVDVYNALVDSGALTVLPAQHANNYPVPGTIGEPNDESNFERLEALP